MKEVFKSIRSGIIVFLTFALCTTIYAAWNKIPEAKPNEVLKLETWNKLINNINALWERIDWWEVIPFALVSAFKDTCPDWWIAADWQNWTPDLRWVFIRWANDFWTWESADKFNIDVDRQKAWSWVYSIQWDAIRNITWSVSIDWWHLVAESGGFVSKLYGTAAYSYYSALEHKTAEFDFSNVVPTWDDNRPRNVALVYCVKK